MEAANCYFGPKALPVACGKYSDLNKETWH